jgi:tetratricopeptide (TPR) repeat protein
MKRISVLFALILSVQFTFAQKAAVQSAINYLRYDDLDKAKEAIDGATTNEGTVGMAKAWYYKGCIYQAINESSNEKFTALKPGSIETAMTAFTKANELDSKSKEFYDDIQKRMSVLIAQLMNEGVDKYREKDYSGALKMFETSIKVKKDLYNLTDTLAMYNAGLAADKAGSKPVAIKYFSELAEIGYGGARTYLLLSSLHFEMKDTTKTLEELNKGRTKFPEDKDLITKQLNLYLITGRSQEAFAQIDAAISKDSANSMLYFNKGVLADQLKKPLEAEAAYKKAIELKPDYFDALYNLGAMYFNNGAEMANKANDIPTNKVKEYEAAKLKFEAKFREALPHLEKAFEINPKDGATLQSLKTLYVRLNDTKKLEVINKAIKDAGQ